MSISESHLLGNQGDLSDDDWRDHIESAQGSPLSLAAYCRQHNLIYNRFLYWKKKLCPKSSPSQSFALIKVKPVDPVASPRSTFSQTENRSAIRLWVKDICVDVGDNFHPATLGKVVQTLQRI